MAGRWTHSPDRARRFAPAATAPPPPAGGRRRRGRQGEVAASTSSLRTRDPAGDGVSQPRVMTEICGAGHRQTTRGAFLDRSGGRSYGRGTLRRGRLPSAQTGRDAPPPAYRLLAPLPGPYRHASPPARPRRPRRLFRMCARHRGRRLDAGGPGRHRAGRPARPGARRAGDGPHRGRPRPRRRGGGRPGGRPHAGRRDAPGRSRLGADERPRGGPRGRDARQRLGGRRRGLGPRGRQRHGDRPAGGPGARHDVPLQRGRRRRRRGQRTAPDPSAVAVAHRPAHVHGRHRLVLLRQRPGLRPAGHALRRLDGHLRRDRGLAPGLDAVAGRQHLPPRGRLVGPGRHRVPVPAQPLRAGAPAAPGGHGALRRLGRPRLRPQQRRPLLRAQGGQLRHVLALLAGRLARAAERAGHVHPVPVGRRRVLRPGRPLAPRAPTTRRRASRPSWEPSSGSGSWTP